MIHKLDFTIDNFYQVSSFILFSFHVWWFDWINDKGLSLYDSLEELSSCFEFSSVPPSTSSS